MAEDTYMVDEVEETTETTPESSADEETPTTIIPVSFFEAAGKDPEVGSKCTVRVLAVHEDSVEVAYESSEDEEYEEEIEEEMMMEAAPAGMQEMME